MKVLFVLDALGEGGTEASTAALLPQLRELGVDPTIAILRSRGDEGAEPALRAAGFAISVVPEGARSVLGLADLVERSQADLVHSALFAATMRSRFARLKVRTPLLTSLVNTSYAPERRGAQDGAGRKIYAVQAFDAITGPLTSHYHAVSNAVADDARRHLLIRRKRITVIPRGRPDIMSLTPREDRTRVRHEFGIPDAAVVGICVARHEHQKDHGTLLSAFELVMKTDPDLHLLLVGRDGTTTSALQEQLRSMECASRVHLAGHRKDVPAFLAASDLFALASRYEGMPGSIIEAMAAGLPVVASDIAPVREVLGSRQLPAAGSPAAFAQAIERVVRDGEHRRSEGAQNRARYLASFSNERSAESMVDLYGRVAGSAARD